MTFAVGQKGEPMSDFEQKIHDMFDLIWDCEIFHPLFESTVGELMESVIRCYNNLPSATPELATNLQQLATNLQQLATNNDCNGCKFVGCYDTDFPCANCVRKTKDYYIAERRADEETDIS